MNIKETDNTGYFCEENLSGWGTKSWEDRRLFAEYFFVPFYYLFRKSNNKKNKNKKNQTMKVAVFLLSGLNIKSITDHKIQQILERKWEVSLLWEHYSLLMGKWQSARFMLLVCENVHWLLVLFILAKMWEREKQRWERSWKFLGNNF